MDFLNYTPFEPMRFESLDINDDPFQVVILRGTFDIIPNAQLRPASVQEPIVLTDEFYQELNTSSIRFESDLAPYKPRSDIIVNANAISPGGKPLQHWLVGVQVGKLQKRLLVTGARYWYHHFVGGWKIGNPEPCTEVPIKYEYAYGGQWRYKEESGVCEENPVGVGYVNKKYLSKSQPLPAPRVMSPHDSEMELGESYKPEGLSVITKSWLPRRAQAGTYDEQWLKERHPYLPKDFDYAFYNSAHPSLIYDGYLKGDEAIVLQNLHPQHSTLNFYLPNCEVLLFLGYSDGKAGMCKLNLDTLHLEVAANRAYLVWRGQLPVVEKLRTIEARVIIPDSHQQGRGNGR